MACGDPESALICKRISTIVSFQCGQPLCEVLKDVLKLSEECKQYKVKHVGDLNEPLRRCIKVLITQNGNEEPWILPYEASSQQGDSLVLCQHLLLQMVLAYFFGKDEQVAELYCKCLDSGANTVLVVKFEICTCHFYGGLAAIAMTKLEPDNQKWSRMIDDSKSKLKTWASASSWNCDHRLLFLEAEAKAIRGDVGTSNTYQRALELAQSHGFSNEEALFRERYAAFLRRSGDETSAKQQHDKAFDVYMKWGALRKCEDLKCRYLEQGISK